jgi:para-nitrobenzyl esterase
MRERIGRRDLLKGAACVLGGNVVTAAAAAMPVKAVAKEDASCAVWENKPTIAASSTLAIAETKYGRVSGYVRRDILAFKGIPYAGTTEGANRFKAPVKPESWTGVRSSKQFGNVSPQAAREGWKHDEEAWLFSWNDGIPGEDCLRLNVWTPGLQDGKKRPVMVWLHGGGFTAGSGQELASYDGENLSRRGDVVVVSLNHRLGVLGFLNVSHLQGGESVAQNVGMLDIVAALEWVRDNIASFGGDPGCVTVFGQSGGGGKVNSLLTMPSAAGLFHRAIVQSGSLLSAASEEGSLDLTKRVLENLSMPNATLDDLQKLPVQQLIDAGVKATQRPRPAEGVRFDRPTNFVEWGTVVDGKTMPHVPDGNNPNDYGASVPLLVGTVRNEFVNGIGRPDAFAMTMDDLQKQVQPIYGDKTTEVIETFRRAYPQENAFTLFSLMMATPIRGAAITQVQRRARLDKAPAYLYWFQWKTPVLDGRPMVFHCSEIAFCFDNTDRCENMTGGGPEARALAAKVSDAWINFARTGNPNTPGLPHWPTVTADSVPTMIFDNVSVVKTDPDKAEQAVVKR